jgi:hypothetical protein
MSATAASNTHEIPRAHAKDLTPAAFIAKYVDRNQPVIIEGALTQWKPPASATATDADSAAWSIATLQRLIGSSTVNNVFIASAQHRRRFKYFKAEAAEKGAEQQAGAADTVAKEAAAPVAAVQQESSDEKKQASSPDSGLTRSAMTFNEFVEKSTEAAASTDPNALAYYVRIPRHLLLLKCSFDC